MKLSEIVAGSNVFGEVGKCEQAEMVMWTLAVESPPPANGLSITAISEEFHVLGLPRPNTTRTKDHFRRSRNVRSLSKGLYLPTRRFHDMMSKEFGEKFGNAVANPLSLSDIPLPPFVSEERRADLERMLPVYAHLFLLENSMRGLVESVLTKHLGEEWWDKAANSAMKRKHADRLQNELTKKWAPARTDFGPLFSLDWSDLITLMRKYQELFEPAVGEIAFLNRYDDAAMFRHVVAHNGALRDTDHIDQIGIDFRTWIKQVA